MGESNESLFSDDPSLQFRVRTLPVLQNLAVQVILAFNDLPPNATSTADVGVSSRSSNYRVCKRLFDQTRSIYSQAPFIDGEALQFYLPQHMEIIALANRATFISDILDLGECSLIDLHDNFLSAFASSPGSWRLSLTACFVELKTQVFLSSLLNSRVPPVGLLDDLFTLEGNDAFEKLRTEDFAAYQFSEDLLENCIIRRDALANSLCDGNENQPMPSQFPWKALTDSIFVYLYEDVGPELQNALDTGSFGALGGPDASSETVIDSESKEGSKRKLWTPEQEQVLLAALAEVGGPHWAHILSLHGKTGSKSRVLASKSQVQIKDKARNLKFSYLKANMEVPDCLRLVTGELPQRSGRSEAGPRTRSRHTRT